MARTANYTVILKRDGPWTENHLLQLGMRMMIQDLKNLAALSKYDEKGFSNVIAWGGSHDEIERLKLDAE